ncbi:MAG: hypothetical protein JW881_11525 [Spirochaetales bacterium]|nr:hypothetical protein [Spirochaetales bacterium]
MNTSRQKILTTINRIGYGYAHVFKNLFFSLLLVLILLVTSIIIVVPFWFFSTSFTMSYTIFVIVLFLVIALFLLIWKISKGKHWKKIGMFFALLVEFVMILALYMNEAVEINIIAVLLSFEFLFFLTLIKKKTELIFPGMAKIIIFIAFCGLVYAVSVCISRNLLWLGIPVGIVYFLIFGNLVYEKQKNFKKYFLEKTREKEA